MFLNDSWITNIGAGGGIVSMALTYPLVSISSRLQVQKNDESKDAYKVIWIDRPALNWSCIYSLSSCREILPMIVLAYQCICYRTLSTLL